MKTPNCLIMNLGGRAPGERARGGQTLSTGAWGYFLICLELLTSLLRAKIFIKKNSLGKLLLLDACCLTENPTKKQLHIFRDKFPSKTCCEVQFPIVKEKHHFLMRKFHRIYAGAGGRRGLTWRQASQKQCYETTCIYLGASN